MAHAHMRAAILIIDDDAIIRRVLAKAIADLGFEPMTADNAVDGIAMAVQTVPMGVIVDSTLPDIPLVSALRLLSSIVITKSIPLFVLALRVPPTVSESLRSIGVRSFLEKPFTKSSLEQRLQAVYGQRIMALMKQRRAGIPQGLENAEEFSSTLDHPFVAAEHPLDEPWQEHNDKQNSTLYQSGQYAETTHHQTSDFTSVRGSTPQRHGATRRDSAGSTGATRQQATRYHDHQPDYVSMSLAEVARMYGDRSRTVSTHAVREILDPNSAMM